VNTSSNQCGHCGGRGHVTRACPTFNPRNNNSINAVNDGGNGGGRSVSTDGSNVTLSNAFQRQYPRPNGGRGGSGRGSN
jgi:hypothetical protein